MWELRRERVFGYWGCEGRRRERVGVFWGGRESVAVDEVLSSGLGVGDMLWLALREEVVGRRVLRLFSCACAERSLSREFRELRGVRGAVDRVKQFVQNGRKGIGELSRARGAAAHVREVIWVTTENAEDGARMASRELAAMEWWWALDGLEEVLSERDQERIGRAARAASLWWQRRVLVRLIGLVRGKKRTEKKSYIGS